ncbi:hypothetical protein E1B28_013741 [Marasmius oreades]|uniref:Uncharacterized protein n=1 Tax=Marasmius oreades TaxID=181124 RepID=A0A9P7UNC1_9AGAR|nr:uncharacterized protein E1B28_013741 [Marasmius oreades]KAG7087800.1 hypothetical protein E1B28_013741 [Marasmius oreades]
MSLTFKTRNWNRSIPYRKSTRTPNKQASDLGKLGTFYSKQLRLLTMKFSAVSSLIATACLALSVGAAPSANPSELVEKDLEARASCSYAYNGSTGRGPGTRYSCSSVSWVQFSYVCYVSSTTSGSWCCSGNLVQTSAGPMVGGCFDS